MRYLPIVFFVASISLCCKADTDFSFSGFGTVGITTSDSKNYGFRQNISKRNGIYSGDWKFEDASLIGLQLDLTFNNNFQFISQLVLKDQVEQSFNDALELGFFRYNPSPAWSFRIGRTALDLFMMTEYRNVGFAYPWAHVPIELYGIVPNQNLDGVDLAYTLDLNQNLLRLKTFFGKSDSIIVTDRITLDANLENVYGMSLEYEFGNHIMRGNYTQAKTIDNESYDTQQLKAFIATIPSFIWPESNKAYDILSTDGKTFKYTTLGYKYNDVNWLVQSEIAQINSNSMAVSKLNNAYINISKKFNFNDIYMGYATTNSYYRYFAADQPDAFKEISLIVENAMNIYATKQYTYSLGWRWRFADNYSFKLQLDKTKLYKNRNTLWLSKGEATENESVHTVSANISFIF
jgi:hypothetical protein